MSFTKQNSSARRIFRFMGWAGSLVVLIVSIGLPEQGAYQLLPMLPFVLPLFAIWFSRDGEENDGIERRGRKKKNKEVWAAYFYKPSFLTASSPCLSVGESGGSRCCASVWSIQ